MPQSSSMILRCKHCLDLLVSLLSLVLPNAHSPLRTNFSFVFRQEMKLPNVFAIWLARAKITKKKNGCPHKHGFSFEQVGHQNTRLTQWVHYSVLPKIPQKSLSERKKIHLFGSRRLLNTPPSLSGPRQREEPLFGYC